jgi:hypothetical protein
MTCGRVTCYRLGPLSGLWPYLEHTVQIEKRPPGMGFDGDFWPGRPESASYYGPMAGVCDLEGCSVPLTGAQTRYCSKLCGSRGWSRAQPTRSGQPRSAIPGPVPQGDVAAIGELLIELLREDRAAGFEFEEAWAEDVRAVVRSLVKDEERRQEWIVSLEKGRDVWAAGYRGDLTIVGSPAARVWWPFCHELSDPA